MATVVFPGMLQVLSPGPTLPHFADEAAVIVNNGCLYGGLSNCVPDPVLGQRAVIIFLPKQGTFESKMRC